MINFFTLLFGGGKEKEYFPPKSYSEKSGDTLTQHEKHLLLSTGKCPDCSGELLVNDAGAGIASSCSSCGATFNSTPALGAKPKNKKESMPIMAHRTSNRRVAIPKEELALT